VLLRSTGMEPTNFEERVKWHIALPHDSAGREQLQRLRAWAPWAPARATSTRKSARTASSCRAVKPRSPTCSTTWPGVRSDLVGLWDVVAFDEVAGISFKDKDGVQIMKDYMASGSFARGRDSINAYASMVFVGNINQPVDTLVKTSHLFRPIPGGDDRLGLLRPLPRLCPRLGDSQDAA
jgi:ATP-dependent Lon protease